MIPIGTIYLSMTSEKWSEGFAMARHYDLDGDIKEVEIVLRNLDKVAYGEAGVKARIVCALERIIANLKNEDELPKGDEAIHLHSMFGHDLGSIKFILTDEDLV